MSSKKAASPKPETSKKKPGELDEKELGKVVGGAAGPGAGRGRGPG
jgi:hypothetical protein